MLRDIYRNGKDKMIKKSKEFITMKVRILVISRQRELVVIRKDKEEERYIWGLLGNVALFRLFLEEGVMWEFVF